MKRKMTRRARAGKCGGLVASGASAWLDAAALAQLGCCKRALRASEPNPQAEVRRKLLLEESGDGRENFITGSGSGYLLAKKEIVRSENGMAELDPCFGPR
jgi:hypothetical protein